MLKRIKELIASWKFQEADRLARTAERYLDRAVKLRIEANKLTP